jgi:hypothetical protein
MYVSVLSHVIGSRTTQIATGYRITLAGLPGGIYEEHVKDAGPLN